MLSLHNAAQQKKKEEDNPSLKVSIFHVWFLILNSFFLWNFQKQLWSVKSLHFPSIFQARVQRFTSSFLVVQPRVGVGNLVSNNNQYPFGIVPHSLLLWWFCQQASELSRRQELQIATKFNAPFWFIRFGGQNVIKQARIFDEYCWFYWASFVFDTWADWIKIEWVGSYFSSKCLRKRSDGRLFPRKKSSILLTLSQVYAKYKEKWIG